MSRRGIFGTAFPGHPPVQQVVFTITLRSPSTDDRSYLPRALSR